jgi:cell division protein FtsQ
MKYKINVRRELKFVAVLVVVFGLIAFTERMRGDTTVRDIQIRIENIQDNHFLEEQDVLDLMQLDHQNLVGASLKKMNFKDIEKRIKSDPYISDAQLYSDLRGNLTVKVELRRPIARMVRNDGPDGYIAEDGTIMPVSDRFTSRVVLLSGQFVKQLLRQQNMKESEEGKQLMTMLSVINEDEFWRAQITELDVDGNSRVSLVPQVGDEKIEFGKPEDFEIKFKKLRIFYKEILPRVGWNKYERVNLEFAGQIVAE